jgi:RNA polymerase sigma-70 factor (ECF subfamily)
MSLDSLHNLAARLARGEDSAFTELYDSCGDRLYRYLAVRLGSQEAAADIVQQAFLRAVKGRRRFRRVENPVAYMFQIARNEAARAAKRNIAQRLSTDELLSANDGIYQLDDAEAVAAALGRLVAEDRELVEMRIYGGLKFREIADVTGLPQGTVATRYRRAIDSLRGWLTQQFR